MSPQPETISDLQTDLPQLEAVAKNYADLQASFDAASDDNQRAAVVDRWNQLRKEIDTCSNLVELRFHQDTSNEKFKSDRDYMDSIHPKLKEHSVTLMRKLLNSDHRGTLESEFGQLAFAHWEAEITTYDPAIEQDLVAQAKLESRYIELQAAAKFDFQGEKCNMSTLGKFAESKDREVRRQADELRWAWYQVNGEELDSIYDALVKLRHGMAQKLGFDNFVELGYKLLHRIDYGQDEVAKYRQSVEDHVVPLGLKLRERQRESLGLEQLKYWDLALFDSLGNPAPQGDHDWMLVQAQSMFDEMSSEIGDFFKLMQRSDLLDLKSRNSKAGGGFCTSFPTVGWPFIYANFNGSKGDVEVFTHEVGHALQCYLSNDKRVVDYLWPTYEACEIHSMGLEFLTWPHMEMFFGDDAERFRQIHLTESLLFLPYGVAIDHFQHLVYESPTASTADRHAMWQEVEQRYLPWRDYGGVGYPSKGGAWQDKRHVYLAPFYYIDYTLALCCAMQFWLHAEEDRPDAIRRYLQLCRRGGEASFLDLVESAQLISPFADGCLTDVVKQAAQALQV
jgi:M3 family oligoendopeptidase